MKNRKAKKGFTIIELVIVIAVIGILAAVLIPTFSNVIDKANATAAMENAKNAYTNFLVDNAEKLDQSKANFQINVDNKYYFEVKAGQFDTTVHTKTIDSVAVTATFDKAKNQLTGIKVENGAVVVG